MGIRGDTILAHISPREAALLRARGGEGTINKRTGLRQYESDSSDSGGEGPGGEGPGGEGPSGASGPGTGADGSGDGTGGVGGGGNANGNGGTQGGNTVSGGANGMGVGGGNASGGANAGSGQGVSGPGGEPSGAPGTDLGPSPSSKAGISMTDVAKLAIAAATGTLPAAIGVMAGKAVIGSMIDHGVDTGNNPGGTGDPGASGGGNGSEGGGIGPAGSNVVDPPAPTAPTSPVAQTAAQAAAARNALADKPGSYTYGQGPGGAYDFYSLLHPGAANGGMIGPAKGGRKIGEVSGRSYDRVANGIRAYGMGFANGGFANANTHGVGAGRSIPHGLVPGASPGRADALHASVKRGSYIMPADVVSSIGGGNTANGGAKLNNWIGGAGFKSGAGMPGTGFASGGLVDVRLSSGEYHVPPEFVRWLGKGDPDKGAKVLDGHVARIRAKQIAHIRNLPPPK